MGIEYKLLDGGVAHVLLNRPEVMNALDTPGKEALGDCWARAAADSAVRAVVVSGAGPRAFCAGSDVKEMERTGKMVSSEVLLKAIPNIGHELDKPVIAACHGYTIGMGLTVAMHADIRIASRGGKFGFPETPHGMISGFSAVTLPHIVGHGAAMEMMLSGRLFDAAEAMHLGLVHRLVDAHPDAALAEALSVARKLAAQPPVAMAATKRLVMLELRAQIRTYFSEIDRARVDVEKAKLGN